LGLAALLAQGAGAWRPAGWVYHDHPWAYDGTSGDWHWFNTPDVQWVANMGSGQWAKLQNSALASGWVFYQWAFAYAQSNGAWHWINDADTQWVVNMRTAAWSRFGVPPSPAGMTYIRGGTNAGTDPDFGAYSLTVESFHMDKYEVTKALWDEVRAWGLTNGYTDLPAGGGKAADHPVHAVSWFDAVKWCNARSEKEGLVPIYRWGLMPGSVFRSGDTGIFEIWIFSIGKGYRLPAVDEWQYAARGGVPSRRFPWSDDDLIQHSRANYWSSAADVYDTSTTRGYNPAFNDSVLPNTSPAGWFQPNGYGLYDMAGNVWEWCWESNGAYRQIKGGDAGSSSASARVMQDAQFLAVDGNMSGGFRTVLSIH
jgi:hypothetical protein